MRGVTGHITITMHNREDVRQAEALAAEHGLGFRVVSKTGFFGGFTARVTFSNSENGRKAVVLRVLAEQFGAL